MFRHACGYKLAHDGRDTRALQHYLGHKSIQHTFRYTKLSPDQFRDFTLPNAQGDLGPEGKIIIEMVRAPKRVEETAPKLIEGFSKPGTD
jgi:hypothetical protein